MDWKDFKNLSEAERRDEALFVLGVDIGGASSAVAYFDAFRMTPEIMDLSGGYGKPAAPTVVQYVPETGEWVFGEYAVLNGGGRGITIKNLPERLGSKESVTIGGRAESVPGLLAMFIKDLVGSCKNLNPKAEIAGIVVCVPEFMPENALGELKLAFKIAGYGREVIAYVSERECVFYKYFYAKKLERETAVLLDFGNRELRGGVYEITPGGGVTVETASLLHEPGLGMKKLNERVEDFFRSLYESGGDLKKDRRTEESLSLFAYQHRDLLFQKSIRAKPAKLYFNFAYPPFAKTVTGRMAGELIRPFEEGFERFFRALFNKNLIDGGGRLLPERVDSVVACGGGYEMLWARELTARAFPGAKLYIYKNSKCAAAEGASVLAAATLGLCAAEKVVMEDKFRLKYDYGFAVTRDGSVKFHPVVERNAYWWQSEFASSLIVNERVAGPVELEMIKRDADGRVSPHETLVLEGLPERPKGVTKLDVKLDFLSAGVMTVRLADAGFGQLFPSAGYAREFIINL